MTDRRKIGRNNRTRGAAAEREAARLLNVTHLDQWYRNIDRGGKYGDIACPSAVAEVKSVSRAMPALFDGALAQVAEAAEATGKDNFGVLVRYARPGHKVRWLRIEELTT
ncbi:MAG: hypothetical protein IID51_14235 [Proteobacteria bacterium]|nr:hypothetical protein [Pseudomonadota bacterium]